MMPTGLTNAMRPTTYRMMAILTPIGLLGAGGLGGCVNISALDKPIQINLNINVTQEVVYRLDNEAKSLIQQNPGIF